MRNLITENKNGNELGLKHLHKVPDLMDVKSIDGDMRIIEVPSITSFKNFCSKYADYKSPSEKFSMRNEKGEGWSGVNNWSEYEQLLETGDSDVMSKIKLETTKQISDIKKEYKEVLSNYKFDVTGQFFDIGLVLSGVPESWLEPEFKSEESVKIDIYINGAFSADVDKNLIIKNSARLIAICKVLEDHDIQVSIKTVTMIKDYVRNTTENLIVITNVKSYDEPVNYAKVSVVLSPTFLRRGVFKLAEVVVDNIRSGYGYAHHFDNMITLSDEKSVEKFEKGVFK